MPTVTEVLTQAWQIHQSGELPRARAMYEAVIQAAPENANAWCYLGIVYYDLKDFGQSEQCYRKAVEFQPDFPIAWSNMGNTLSALERYDEAIECCQKALQQKPDYVTAMNNLGAIYVKLNRFGDAADLFRRAIEANPDSIDAHRNLGAALIRHGDLKDAAEHSERAVEINPRDADAHKNLGILYLLNGEFDAGWREYEWRFESGSAQLPALSQPRWDGQPLEGRSALLVAEQGLGDAIHFVRYAQILKEHGAGRVIVQCSTVLHALLSTAPGVDELTPLEGVAPMTDTYVPMLSAPGILKTHSVEDIPAPVPYLSIDQQRRDHWQRRLESHGPSFYIGVVWQGSPAHHADRQRSIPLMEYLPLSKIPGVRLVSLQKGFGTEQLAEVRDWNILDFGEDLDADAAFLDTAAIMQCVDLVVTSDTSAAHLAGALNVEAWLALNVSPDWRWLLETSESPWYPSMKLFRQHTAGDWKSVFDAMAAELRSRVLSTGKATCHQVSIPAAPGELLDKLTILEIKREKLSGTALENVEREWSALMEVRETQLIDREELAKLQADLKTVNTALWNIEDAIRVCEREKDFGERFIGLARSVYRQNDERAAIKRKINELLGSVIVEEKSYSEY